jgi:hypothetical protein
MEPGDRILDPTVGLVERKDGAIEAIPLPKRSNEAIAVDLEGLAADLEYTVNAHREANANWIRCRAGGIYP